MAKETKKAAQTRLFENYKSQFNAIPDFQSFLKSCGDKDKEVFTETTFKNYFYKNYECSKELAKAFKAGDFKAGDFAIESVKVKGTKIVGQLLGGSKNEEVTIIEFCKDWRVTSGKTLTDKKLGVDLIKDFVVEAGMWGKRHFFVSNLYGNHIRYTDAYLNQFTETAKLRKQYSVH